MKQNILSVFAIMGILCCLSATLGQPFESVVNMPCDNHLFDHAGERPVSNIIVLKSKTQ